MILGNGHYTPAVGSMVMRIVDKEPLRAGSLSTSGYRRAPDAASG